ncbi:MAG: phosphatidylserine decarboxylase [Rhabdochlamydiaceae bacterium]
MLIIKYLNRLSQKQEEELVYGGSFLKWLYGNKVHQKIASFFLLPLVVKNPLFSKIYGWFQHRPSSKKKILPFIKKFALDPKEFLSSIEDFKCFNDFFVRKLKQEARPICLDEEKAILPADGRYLVYPSLSKNQSFLVKGQSFELSELLQNNLLAQKYENGSMIMARLCPVDYHRFHFIDDGIPERSKDINGYLYSVNPLALRKNIRFLCQNKRSLTIFNSTHFGSVIYIEVGATNVGTIHQTYEPNIYTHKGAEKGFFSFGGSFLILLFEPGKIIFDQDLVHNSSLNIETRGLFGQSLGKKATGSF